MIPQEHLDMTVKAVSDEVLGFYEEFPYAEIEDAVSVMHLRLLATAQIRSYLSGVVANLIQTKAQADKAIKEAELRLAIAESDIAPNLKLGDFESAKMTQSKLLAATLDESIAAKRAERDAIDARAALDFVREHLREFERQSHDLNLRIRLLYSDG